MNRSGVLLTSIILTQQLILLKKREGKTSILPLSTHKKKRKKKKKIKITWGYNCNTTHYYVSHEIIMAGFVMAARKGNEHNNSNRTQHFAQ